MTNKDIITKMDSQLPQSWQAVSDEIDLRELLLVLWRQKLLVFVITALFAAIGVCYAFFAPQQWSAKALITEPTAEDLQPMLRVASLAKALGLTGFPNGKRLYQEFVQEFNSYENRRTYLKASPLFANEVAVKALDEKDQRRWLRDWGSLVVAQPVDKKGEDLGIEIAFAAPTSADSLEMLKGYVDYIVTLQQQQLARRIGEQRAMQLEEMGARYTVMKEEAKRALQQEISEIALANSVAKAAGVSAPLDRSSGTQDRFSIALGSKGLEEKLTRLKSLDLAFYQPKLQYLQAQMERLKHVSLEGISFRPFSYLDAPEEPLSRDKPKRPLIVTLATLLGGVLGVGIVLVRHAFRRPEQA